MKTGNTNLFDTIASAYNLFYNYQKRGFQRTMAQVTDILDKAAIHTILDVGCGTGALASTLTEYGFEVRALDASEKMLSIAKKRKENQGIEFVRADALEHIPFDDDSFDIVIASHVAHGLPKEQRLRLYAEMARVSKHLVIYHDYSEKTTALTSFIEYLEGGDYFNFIKIAEQEMKENEMSAHILHGIYVSFLKPRRSYF